MGLAETVTERLKMTLQEMMMKFGLAVLGSVALLTSVSATAAENPFAQDEAVLNLKGLDLSTADGQQRLAIRMDQAARAVCGDRVASLHLSAGAKARDCRTAVVTDIRDQIEARLAAKGQTQSVQLATLR